MVQAPIRALPAGGYLSAGVRAKRPEARAERVVGCIEVRVLDESFGVMADPYELTLESGPFVRDSGDHDG